MSLPRYNPHYTLSDYQQWEGSWELWHGVAVAMTPSPFGIHQWLSGRFAHQIIQQCQDQRCLDCHVLQEVDWILQEDLVVRPDLSVVCGRLPERFISETPALIIEILSESTRDKDKRWKADLYAERGVRYYAIVDPWSWDCVVYGLHDGDYEAMDSSSAFTIHDGCTLQLRMPHRPNTDDPADEALDPRH
jgi:Uma2 family endonuclease